MKLRNIVIGLALAWGLVSAAFGQQTPAGRADDRHSRVFQDAVLEAEDGATLYADEYGPAIKEAAFIPNFKSLTIIGGVFRATGNVPAVRGAAYATRLVFRGSAFLASVDEPSIYAVISDAHFTVFDGCYSEGTLLGNDFMLLESYVNAGARQWPFDACSLEYGAGFPAVQATRVGIRGGVIIGQAGAQRPLECGCDLMQPGGPGVFANVVAILDSPLILGGFGETGAACAQGARGEPIVAFSVVWGDQ